jgi:hypothetical protein
MKSACTKQNPYFSCSESIIFLIVGFKTLDPRGLSGIADMAGHESVRMLTSRKRNELLLRPQYMLDFVESLNEAFKDIEGIKTFVGCANAFTLSTAVEKKTKQEAGPSSLELQWPSKSVTFSTGNVTVGHVVEQLLDGDCMLSSTIIDQVVESLKVCTTSMCTIQFSVGVGVMTLISKF